MKGVTNMMTTQQETEFTTMKIHEVMYLDANTKIMRVYKGWIYIFREKLYGEGMGEQWVMTSQFVPYD